jgi:putative MATE family efflux protein
MTQPQYTQGSIVYHIIHMSVLSAIGLLSIFLVDLVDLYFLSLLGEVELASAVGFSGTILFFTIAISIGLMIAMGALVSRSIGSKQIEAAREYTVNILVISVILGSIIGLIVWIFIPELLSMMGAKGRTLELSTDYLRIIIPSLPILCIGMSASGALRAVGDAKHAMYVTLLAGLINAVLDPIFIFTFGLGIKGAAWASVLARVGMMIYGLYLINNKHQLLTKFKFESFKKDLSEIFQILIPAILTNIATPIGNVYIIVSLAKFGDSAVAGFSIIGRIMPVAFCLIFALSSAVGPIIGQNHGAMQYQRVKETLSYSFLLTIIYTIAISILLFLLKDWLVLLFNSEGEAANLIRLFCIWVAILTAFRGFLFVANAAFNNLGKAKYSTLMNFGKATLGTIPFVYYGAIHYGAFGIMLFEALGAVLFGIISTLLAYQVVNKLELNQGAVAIDEEMVPAHISETQHLGASSSSLARAVDCSTFEQGFWKKRVANIRNFIKKEP